MIFQRIIGDMIVKLAPERGESSVNLYHRLNRICDEIAPLENERKRLIWAAEIYPQVQDTIAKIERFFGLDNDQSTKAETVSDYHKVILSLMRNFDRSMGSSSIANDWKINTGRVSRVFTASRKSYEKYQGHFEKNKDLGYRFTEKGLEYAIEFSLIEHRGNDLSRILEWLDGELFNFELKNWLDGKVQLKISGQDTFEYSIHLLLGLLDFSTFNVGMYGRSFDLIAYSADFPWILICECTGGSVRKKSSTLKNEIDEISKLVKHTEVIGIVFTPKKVSKTDKKDLSDDRLFVIDRPQIQSLFNLGKQSSSPDHLERLLDL